MIELLIAATLVQDAAGCNAIAPAAPPADCPQWRLVRRADEGEGYVDPASVRRDGNGFEIDTRTVFHRPLRGNISSMNVRVRFDCAARTALILHMTVFSADGTRLQDSAMPAEQPVQAGPNTPYEAVLETYCLRQG